jgi:hypothetical protein
MDRQAKPKADLGKICAAMGSRRFRPTQLTRPVQPAVVGAKR